ncbi:Protein of unknown function [Cotesia congregata]|uniref:Uncharacterized protein n=1 Tax=Cotesia congregata TaxID=51543 RepID=A0A8J2HI32_COTCN|nr:Protein of unknown function [Cotesia congregata]
MTGSLIICAISSLFVYQLHEHNYLTFNNDTLIIHYIKGSSSPPIILVITGLITFAFVTYFWYIIDYKYNRRQIMTFLLTFTLISIIEISIGIWVLIIHEKLGVLLVTSLKKTLSIPAKLKQQTFLSSFKAGINNIKLICCGYNETSTPEFEELTSWFCCNFQRLNSESRTVCEDVYGKECQHLAIHSIRSILLHIFLLTLCSIIIETLLIVIIFCCIKLLMKKKIPRRIELALQKPSAPLNDSDVMWSRAYYSSGNYLREYKRCVN